MPFFDTHAHYYFPEFSSDQDEVIRACHQKGICGMVNVGTGVETSQLSLDLALKYDFVWASAGIHPTDAHEGTPESIQQIETMLSHPKMVAIGEVGLDYYHKDSTPEAQDKVLREFLAIYRRVKKPLIIHCRDAYDALHTIFKEENQLPYEGVMHCYSSDKATMMKFLELGFYISFAGPLTYKKNDELREACRACPKDRLLIETDAPFLPPQSMRGKRNDSLLMLETAQVAADVRGISIEELGELTTANAKRLFRL